MHLKTLTIENFRSFRSNNVSLQKDLTILVGENNSGKSNAIDAIRLLTPPLSGRRDIYCQLTDIRTSSGTFFDLKAVYSDLTDLDLSRFDAAPLMAFIATKEMSYGTETDGRFPQTRPRCSSRVKSPSQRCKHRLSGSA